MRTEIVPLSQVQLNDSNPRSITDDNFRKLVNSILVFPKMLQMRPIAVDSKMVALGGNMRHRALSAIKLMYTDDINERLNESVTYQKKTDAEKQLLMDYWLRWQQNPSAVIVKADEFTEEEKRQFIIADNLSFGAWDYEMLANQWDQADLNDWGMNLWDGAKLEDDQDDEGDTAPTDFKITVTCHSEQDQQFLLSKLQEEGYKCQIK